MPKIHSKEPTLNGQADVVAYADREYLYLRIKRGGRRYTNVSLETTDIRTAHKKALDAYTKAISEPPRSRTRRFSFEKACAEYLEYKHKQAERGQITHRSAGTYEQRVYQRIIPFAKSVGVGSVGDIDKESFSGYGEYFLDVKTKGKWHKKTSGLSASTINADLATLNELLNFLVKHEVLDPRKKGELQKVRDRKNYREESNPAFLPDEFVRFKEVLYKFDQNCVDEIDQWKKRWFINWVLFQYQSGCRVHESSQILIGDTEVQKRPDGKVKGIISISPSTKTGRRTVIMNGNTLRKVKSHLNKGIKLRNEQIKIRNEMVLSGEGKRRKWTKNYEFPMLDAAGKDDFLLMNPFIDGRTVYHTEHIRGWMNEILSKCEFEKRFTLHSLRATHITHALLKGYRTRVIADNVGNSQAEIERTYYRLSNILNIDELGFHKDADEGVMMNE